jgi:dUTP pyrophosphatase
VTVLDAAHTLDANYHGEVLVILINLGQEGFAVVRGAPIALLVIAPVLVVQTEWPVTAE